LRRCRCTKEGERVRGGRWDGAKVGEQSWSGRLGRRLHASPTGVKERLGGRQAPVVNANTAVKISLRCE
jgi:hypothetical protein